HDMDEQRNDIIEGRNAVQEALRAGRAIDKIYIARGETDRALGHIAGLARDRGITVSDCDRRKLDAMSVTHAHQGVIAVCALREYASIDDIFNVAAERGEQLFVVVCDEISDPHNLGAIIRSAECAGAHGVIIPSTAAPGSPPSSARPARAPRSMAVARVAIASALEELKARGLWVYGAAAEGSSPMWDTDFSGPIALVIGRGEGLGRLVRALRLPRQHPLRGKVSSLNASTAAAVLMYEVLRQKTSDEKPSAPGGALFCARFRRKFTNYLIFML
ncbi:MAG: TrmH family RNA methyltransferase, partial [Oscillospiraceae bacterium]